jgi:hypothetical protein
MACGLLAVLLMSVSGWSQQRPVKKAAVLPKPPAGVVIEQNVAYLESGRSETVPPQSSSCTGTGNRRAGRVLRRAVDYLE